MLPPALNTILKKIALEKHSSLFCPIDNKEEIFIMVKPVGSVETVRGKQTGLEGPVRRACPETSTK